MRALGYRFATARHLLTTVALLFAGIGPLTGSVARATDNALAAPAASAASASAPTTSLSTPSAAPGTIVVGTASITYHARAGDTLISIARQYTERSSNWIALGKLNRIDRDSAIPIGTAILIPAELLGDMPAKATVVAMTGTIAAVAADGTATRLTLGATVVEGMQIQTSGNSFLTLALADQSRISVPSNSRIALTTLRTARYINSPRTQVQLLRGRIESRVAPLATSRGRYEVRTPLSVAGVRGTHFRVGFLGVGSSERVATETLEGKVAVATASQAGAPDPLVLAAGQGNITNPGVLGAAVALLPAPQLTRTVAGAAQFAADRIALTTVSGARAYHLQIASDAEAINLLAETRSSAAVLTLDGVADGDYFVRLSAIDRFGLEGMVSVVPITLRADASNAPSAAGTLSLSTAPMVAASDDKSLTLRWKAQGSMPMRLQLARDSAFSYLLANRVSSTGEARLARPPFGTYFARVELLDSAGAVRAVSAAQSLIVTDQWIMPDGNPIPARPGRVSSNR